jgi:hypothetical protein
MGVFTAAAAAAGVLQSISRGGAQCLVVRYLEASPLQKNKVPRMLLFHMPLPLLCLCC